MNYSHININNPNSESIAVSLTVDQANELIVQKAKQLVNKLIEKRGHDKPPFLPEEFIRFQGIERIEKADLGNTSAVLLRFYDGYVIKVNQNHWPVRQNFSCAHEIGHILFSELKLEQYIRNIEYRTFNPQGEQKARSRARERLCDVAAAELLMPEFVFRKYLSGFGLSISSVERLANVFKVSFEAATMRIAEVSVEPCIALKWLLQRPLRRGIKSKTLSLKSRVGPGRKPRGKNNYMPVYTTVRPSSTLYKACQYDTTVKSSIDFKLDNIKKRCPIESKGFSSGETRYVISLAFPDR